MSLPPGWQTDVAVLRLGGAEVVERADHLVVREPLNPRHHWGNFLLVTDAGAVDDAPRWLGRFAEEFPEAEHVALGLVAEPVTGAWEEHGLVVETDDVLSTERMPEQRPCPDGYTARAFSTADDWARHVAVAVHANEESREHEATGYLAFVEARAETRRNLVERGLGAWFGAFHGEELVAELGIVNCGAGTARYQAVGTDAGHRRMGLAGHLIGLAAEWAAQQRCARWVIITEIVNPAGRLYRSLGFLPDVQNVQVYRAPKHPAAQASVSL